MRGIQIRSHATDKSEKLYKNNTMQNDADRAVAPLLHIRVIPVEYEMSSSSHRCTHIHNYTRDV